MPLLKERYTSKDYWALPEGCRSELIDGQLYDIAVSYTHLDVYKRQQETCITPGSMYIWKARAGWTISFILTEPAGN